MTDTWTVASADRTSIVVNVSVDGIVTTLTLDVIDVDLSNEQDLLAALRDLATRFREAQIAQQTPPVIVNALVGHTEAF